MDSKTADPIDLLLSIALDLNASLTTEDRYRRLIAAVRRVLPCDAAALLRFDHGNLLPLAAHGLSTDAVMRTYAVAAHPRLAIICRSDMPVRFPPTSDLPDPFDGMLEADPDASMHIHACLGCPLRVDGELIGVLTADARLPNAFDDFEPRFLAALGALAGAALRTSGLIDALEELARRRGYVAEELQRDQEQRHGGVLIGTHPVMNALRTEIARQARSDFLVLITGETGTGKELVARSLHAASPRAAQPLIYVNCAALPESVAESELFGHVRGAFTGAVAARAGKFEIAEKGTLFLDEVGELPPAIQPKLLRAIQEGEIQRVGSDKTLRVDVRIIAATNRDLEREVAEGRFRADLFHRFNVLRIRVPALRDHIEDLPLLAGYFCDMARRRLGLDTVRIHHEVYDLLRMQSWPGNVRELENTVLRAVLTAASRTPRGEIVLVRSTDLSEMRAHSAPSAGASRTSNGERSVGADVEVNIDQPLRAAVDEFQRKTILRTVDEEGGNWAAAARRLGLARSNLHTLAKRLGIR